MGSWDRVTAAACVAWLMSGFAFATGPQPEQHEARSQTSGAVGQTFAARSPAPVAREALSPIVPIAFSAHDETEPAIAYNPDRDEYFVIWDDNSLNAIRGVILNPDGTPKAEPFFLIAPASAGVDFHGMTLVYHPGVRRMYAFGIREEAGGSRVIGVAETAARDFGIPINLTNLGVYVGAYALARLTDNDLDFLFACVLAGVTNVFRSRLGPDLQPIGSPIQTTFFNSPPGVGSFSAAAVPSGTLLGVAGPNAIFAGLIGAILFNFEPFLSTPARVALACIAALSARGPDSCAGISSDVAGRVYFQRMTLAGELIDSNRVLLEEGGSDPEYRPLLTALGGQYVLGFQNLQGDTSALLVDATGEPALPSIPLLQRLFARNGSIAARQELAILLTAEVVLPEDRRDADADVLVRVANPDPAAISQPSMLVAMDRSAYAQTDTVDLMITYGRGSAPTSADAYLLLQLPDGSLRFGPDLSATPKKHRNNFVVEDGIDPLRVKGLPIAGLPAGTYTWYWGLTRPDTLELIGAVGTRSFTIAAR
jgi:hypothetical protein